MKGRAPKYNTFKMYLHLFLLLFSSGVSSYFLPLKETPHLLNETNSIIEEILCLLEAEKGHINETFLKPLHIWEKHCAHNITEKFIDELKKKMPSCKCMQIVEKDMEELEKNCSILQKSSSNDKRCSETAITYFPQFKKSLEDFLKWINGHKHCRNIRRSESGLYLDCKCSCHGPWKHKGLH